MSQHAQGRALLQPGALVDGFRVLHLLGRGGMGEVYLARDTQLGRKVALKLVRPEVLGDAQAVERFLFEARVTARFSHPHIVLIYGVGAWEGHPYVALEYLEGQSLRQRLETGRLGAFEAARLALAIADALAEAHSHGVLHRDLKPENVQIPRDGRLRVLDFGLAKALTGPERGVAETVQVGATAGTRSLIGGQFQTAGGGIKGTPLYMAPEQWLEQEQSGSTDVWALGVMLYEMLAGRRPYEAPTVFALCANVCSAEAAPVLDVSLQAPGELAELVARCLLKQAAGRPSAAEARDALVTLLERGRGRIRGEESPFRGLLPFTEQQAEVFFGREAEAAAFVERMRDEPLLAVVGPSGAGKSSFVQAGVVPLLREQGKWVVLALRPGASPFEALASRLARGESNRTRMSGSVRSSLGAGEEAGLAAELGGAPGRLGLKLAELAEREQARVLLVVDQLEELYALVEDEGVRRKFMQAVCGAADDAGGAVRVVLTLRDDFLGKVAESAEAQRALSRVTVLRSPGPEALAEIVTRPLGSAGYRYEDEELPREMVAAVQGEPACLPLLQFACAALWDARDRGRKVVTRAAYAALGGVEGALARHADGILGGLTADQVRAAREIFLRLVTPEGTRRAVKRGALIEGLGAGAERTLDRLIAERALVSRKGREAESAEVELVHESLVRNWERYRRWIEESKEELVFLAEAGQAAALWEKRGRAADGLWRGDALRDAERKASRIESVPEAVRLFLAAGRTQERHGQKRKRLAVLLGFVFLAVVALVLAWQGKQAREQRNLAKTNEQEALRRTAEILADGARSAVEAESMFAARAQVRSSMELLDSIAVRALWQRQTEKLLVAKFTIPAEVQINDISFSPDGQSLAAVGYSKGLRVVDVANGRTTAMWPGTGVVGQFVRCLRNGSEVAASFMDGRIMIWNTRSGKIESLDLPAGNTIVASSSDSRLLASATHDKIVRLWDLATRRQMRTLAGHADGIFAIAFSPDSRILVSAGRDEAIFVWDVETGELLRKIVSPPSLALAFRTGTRLFASSHADGVVRLWDADSGTELRAFHGHRAKVWTVAFSPDGRLLASGSEDRTTRLWQADTGRQIAVMRGDYSDVLSLAFDPTGRQLAASVNTENRQVDQVRVWNVDRMISEARSARDHGAGNVWDLDVSADGRLASAVDTIGHVRLLDLPSGTSRPLDGLEGILSARLSPDASVLATAGDDQTVRLWRTDTGSQISVLGGHRSTLLDLQFSPDGALLASASVDRTINLWEVATGRLRSVMRGHVNRVNSLAFRHDGKALASVSNDGTLRLWDVADGRPLARFDIEGPGIALVGVAYSWDDRHLAIGGWAGKIHVVDTRDNTQRVLAQRKGWTIVTEFRPGTDQIAFYTDRQLPEIIDRETGHADRLPSTETVSWLMFDPSGKRIVTLDADRAVRLWMMDTGRPVWRAPALLAPVPKLYSQRGWTRLDTGSRTEAPAGTKWRAVVENDGRIASQSPDRRLLCVHTYGGSLELWDLIRDVRLFHTSARDASTVLGLDRGCAVLFADGKARRFGENGIPTDVGEKTTAIARDGRGILAATEKGVVFLNEAGIERRLTDSGSGATAVARMGSSIALGWPDGRLQLVAASSRAKNPEVEFEPPPRALASGSPVIAILAGPVGTLIAGYNTGFVGIWNTSDGALLNHSFTRGAPVHMMLVGQKLYCASDVGDYAVLDLSVFTRPYCDLLREIWREVPVVWESGKPVRRDPPKDHPCAGR